MSKATPGPWTKSESKNAITILEGNVEVCVLHFGPRGERPSKADDRAALIAAAPELRDVLRELVCLFSDAHDRGYGLQEVDVPMSRARALLERLS